MRSYNSSEILISVLRSASFLLQHYGYNGHDPSLSELQRSLGLAVSQLEAQMPTENASSALRISVMSRVPKAQQPTDIRTP
jgi:hypothetical protein